MQVAKKGPATSTTTEKVRSETMSEKRCGNCFWCSREFQCYFNPPEVVGRPDVEVNDLACSKWKEQLTDDSEHEKRIEVRLGAIEIAVQRMQYRVSRNMMPMADEEVVKCTDILAFVKELRILLRPPETSDEKPR